MYLSPSKTQATYSSHPRSVQKMGLEARLQHKSKFPSRKQSWKHVSLQKTGIKVVGLSLNGLLEQWARLWMEAPGEATQGNSVLPVLPGLWHQN